MFERMDWEQVLNEFPEKWVKMQDVVFGMDGVVLEGTVLEVVSDEDSCLDGRAEDEFEGYVWRYVPLRREDEALPGMLLDVMIG